MITLVLTFLLVWYLGYNFLLDRKDGAEAIENACRKLYFEYNSKEQVNSCSIVNIVKL